MDVEMRLGSSERQASGGIRGEVTEVPTFDELAESGNPRMLFQRTQDSNSEPAHIRKLDDLGFPGLFLFLARGNGFHQTEDVKHFPLFIDLTTVLITFPNHTFSIVQHKKRE